MRSLLIIIVALVFVFGFSTIHFLNSQQKLVTIAPSPQMPTPTPTVSGVYGTYQATSMNKELTLVITPEKKVLLSTDYKDGKPPITEAGNWKMSSNTVEITLTSSGNFSYDKPVTIVLKQDGENLNNTSAPILFTPMK